MATTDEMTLTIHLGRPFRNWWSATIDGYDGTRCEHDPSQDDNRTGTATNKWDAIRNLIDALEELETRKAKVTG